MSQNPPGTAQTAIRAIIGRRSQQQDTASETIVKLDDGREALLVIVADGMGGAVGGQIASSRAAAAFAAHAAASAAPLGERLRDALGAANGAIAAAVAQDSRLTGMGSTLIGAVVDGRRLDWISVGDSLLLAIVDGRAERLNADHSMGGVLDRQVERGEISAAQAAASEQRHLLRSALVGGPIELVDAGSATLAERARLVVASDGVLTLTFAELAQLVSASASLEEAAGKVVEAVEARQREDQDNMTIAVVAPGAGWRGAAATRGGTVDKRRASRRCSPLALALLVLGIALLAAAGAAVYRRSPPAAADGAGDAVAPPAETSE